MRHGKAESASSIPLLTTDSVSRNDAWARPSQSGPETSSCCPPRLDGFSGRNPAPAGSDLAVGGFAVADDAARVWDFTADGVRRSLEESLNRLGLDRIDIAYVHDPDHAVGQAIAEAIPALLRLRDEGVLKAVGVGMNQWQAPLRMVRETDIDVVMLAGRWTLLDRSGEALADECAERGVALVAAAPFNSGILAQPWPPEGAHYDYGPAPADVLERARQLARTCDEAGGGPSRRRAAVCPAPPRRRECRGGPAVA